MSANVILSTFTRLAAAVDDFLLACEANDLSPKTIETYRRPLRRVLAFAGDVRPDQLDAALLRRWQKALADEGLSATTRGDYLRPVKTWIRWMDAEGGYGVDARLADRLKAPHNDTEQPIPFTEAEIAKLFAACRANGWMGQRMRAILAVLLDTGVRVSELGGLTIADVDLGDKPQITVRAATSKSRRTRTIALGRRAKQECGRWWFVQRAAWDQSPASPFFCSRTERPLSRNMLYNLLMFHGRKAGVADIHPHKFRHTFAIFSLRAGMSPSVLMACLGHTSFEMTQKYIKLSQADVSEEKRAKSPLDQIRLR
jgi:site-specific recombinase XerD